MYQKKHPNMYQKTPCATPQIVPNKVPGGGVHFWGAFWYLLARGGGTFCDKTGGFLGQNGDFLVRTTAWATVKHTMEASLAVASQCHRFLGPRSATHAVLRFG